MISSNWYSNLWRVVVIACVALTVACTPLTPQPEMPSQLALKQLKPSIRGTITDVFQKSDVPHGIFVEGVIESDTSYDRAFIRISDDTRIYLLQDKIYTLTSAAQLTIGLQVESVFTGTILESYPVQVTAEEILILEKAP